MSGYQLSLSLVGFNDVDSVVAYQQAQTKFGFELSYKMSNQFLAELRPHLQQQVHSVHACCPSEPIFPNLGSFDAEVIETSLAAIEKSAVTAASFGADILVLHPGYATDLAIPAANAQRQALLEQSQFTRYQWEGTESICRPDYIEQDEYQRHLEQAFRLLPEAQKLCAKHQVRLAVENLNPRVAYLFQTPDEIIALVERDSELYLCLDIAHLWISAQVYRFDYLQAIKDIMGTGRVINCHLHTNASAYEKMFFIDSHDSIWQNEMPLREVIKLIAVDGVNVVLETIQDPLENSRVLLEYLDG